MVTLLARAVYWHDAGERKRRADTLQTNDSPEFGGRVEVVQAIVQAQIEEDDILIRVVAKLLMIVAMSFFSSLGSRSRVRL